MSNVTISDAIRYIGVDDKDIDLFESQYIVPNGVSYNSYVILDEKIVVMDTVDARKTDEWLEKLERELDGKTPDYLVISHLEPDHSGSIQAIAEKYPQMQFVSNAKVFAMLPQFFEMDVTDKKVVVVVETFRRARPRDVLARGRCGGEQCREERQKYAHWSLHGRIRFIIRTNIAVFCGLIATFAG